MQKPRKSSCAISPGAHRQGLPALVENVQVDVYGSMMRPGRVAGITTPESRTLVIQPWDASTVTRSKKAFKSQSWPQSSSRRKIGSYQHARAGVRSDASNLSQDRQEND